MLAVPALLTACSNDNESTPEQSEIRLKSDVWKMMEGTRATTFDEVEDLQAEAHFTCVAYEAGTLTPYISTTTVDWDEDDTRWEFNNGASHYYWPTEGSLDFFAYAPQVGSLPSYVSAVTYAVDGTPAAAPYFTCGDLPLSLSPADGTQEFVWALTTGQNRADHGVSGVTMIFKHPFARVKFKLSTSNNSNVTVNSITIPEIYCDGTCTLTGTGNTATSAWSSLSDNDEGLEITGSPATSDDAFYLVIPNDYGSKTLSVAITWKEWDVEYNQTLTAPLTIDWVAGYSYTYSLSITKNDLRVNIERFTEQW